MSEQEEITSPLAQEAAAHHELFLTYVSVGFSEDQAMALLIALLTQGFAHE